MYDGKRPKALDVFLNILNIKEDEFYSMVENHVVPPHNMPEKEYLKKNSSNISPSDISDWHKKFT